MNERLRTLPDEIENLTLTESMPLTMLLDKYPHANMETFLQDLTVVQLDRIYRYGCVSKIFAWCSKGYAMNIIQPIILDLTQLPTHIIITELTRNCWPKGGYNDYWQNNNIQPSKEEYIRSISDFCFQVLKYSQNNKVSDKIANLFFCEDFIQPHNKEFVSFCENLVRDVIVGALIMRKNM